MSSENLMNLFKRFGAPVLAAGLVGFFVWTALAPEPPARVPKVTEILEGRETGRPETRATDGPSKSERGDSPVAGGTRGKKVLFSIPKHRYAPLGRLEIRGIDLRATYRDGVFDEILTKGPGHWPGTPLPGEAGNSVLSGHRTTYTHPFGDLDRLDRGDNVITTTHENKPVLYRVTKTTIVPEERYVDFVLRQPKGRRVRRLTMFACHPKGYRTYRIVVQAEARKLPRRTIRERAPSTKPQ